MDLQRVTLYFENQLFLVLIKDLAKINQALHCDTKDSPSSTFCTMNQGDYRGDLQRVTLYFENQLFLVLTKDSAKINQASHCGPKDSPSSTFCKKGEKNHLKTLINLYVRKMLFIQ